MVRRLKENSFQWFVCILVSCVYDKGTRGICAHALIG
mgnify:CR=1 FL=1